MNDYRTNVMNIRGEWDTGLTPSSDRNLKTKRMIKNQYHNTYFRRTKANPLRWSDRPGLTGIQV